MGILRKIIGESPAAFRRRSQRLIKNARIHAKKTGEEDAPAWAQGYQDDVYDSNYNHETGEAWGEGSNTGRRKVQSFDEHMGSGSPIKIPDYIGRRRRKVGAGVVAVSAAGANKDALLGFDKGRYEK